MCDRVYAIQITTTDEKEQKILSDIWEKLSQERKGKKEKFLKDVYKNIINDKKPEKKGGGDGDESPYTWSQEEVAEAVKKLGGNKASLESLVKVLVDKIQKGYDEPRPTKEATEGFRKEYGKELNSSQITLKDALSLIYSSLPELACKEDQTVKGRFIVRDEHDREICILHGGPSAFYWPLEDDTEKYTGKLVVYDGYESNCIGDLCSRFVPPKPGARPIVFKHGYPGRHYVLDDFGIPTRRYVYVVKSKYQVETLKAKGKIVGRHVGKIDQMIEMTKKLSDTISKGDKEDFGLLMNGIKPSPKEAPEQKAIKHLHTLLKDEGDLGKQLYDNFYNQDEYDPQYRLGMPIDVFSTSENKQYEKFVKWIVADRFAKVFSMEAFDDAGQQRINRLGKDLALLYIHQREGTGSRQRGNALTQTLTPNLSNDALPFGSEGAQILCVDLGQVPVPKSDQPPNLVNFFSKLYGKSVAEVMQGVATEVKLQSYSIAWSTEKNREIFLRELKSEWVVSRAKPHKLEMKGTKSFIDVGEESLDDLLKKRKNREWNKLDSKSVVKESKEPEEEKNDGN